MTGKKRLLIMLLNVFWAVVALALVWPSTPALARLERTQLLNIASSLKVLQERLIDKKILLNRDDRDHEFFWTVTDHGFPNYEEVRIALESALIGATTEDRAKVEGLLQSLEQLNSSATDYEKAVKKSQVRPRQPEPKEIEMSESEEEKLRDLIASFRPKILDEKLAPAQEKKAAAPARKAELSKPKPRSAKQAGHDRRAPNHLSGSLAPGLESDDFPSWAVAPPADEKAESAGKDAARVNEEARLAREKAQLAREQSRLTWINLEVQYETVLNQVGDLRAYFLNQLAPN